MASASEQRAVEDQFKLNLTARQELRLLCIGQGRIVRKAMFGPLFKIVEFEAVPTPFDKKYVASHERLNFFSPAVFYG